MELEAMLGDDPAAYLVYADRLTERGDPRGELILLQVERQVTPGVTAEQDLIGREREIVRDNDRFLPAIARDHATCDWRWGFFWHVVFRRDWLDGPRGEDVIGTVLDVPAAMVARQISFSLTDGRYLRMRAPAIMDRLARAPLATRLEEVLLSGDLEPRVAERLIDRAAFPKLSRIRVDGCAPEATRILRDAPHIRVHAARK